MLVMIYLYVLLTSVQLQNRKVTNQRNELQSLLWEQRPKTRLEREGARLGHLVVWAVLHSRLRRDGGPLCANAATWS